MSDPFRDSAGPDGDQIRLALDAVTSSKNFEASNRLSAFLSYVVEEQLAGRGDLIRAKRIAADVYGRPPEDGPESETVVRVDAGRLRRRLDQYYAEEGKDDPVRIIIKSGGYAPTFKQRSTLEQVATAEGQLVNQSPRLAGASRWWLSVAAVVAVLLITGGVVLLGGYQPFPRIEAQRDAKTPVPADKLTDTVAAQRSALFEKSASVLMAQTHINEARDIVYPPINSARVQSSVVLCELAIELDPTNPGGYACAARAYAFLAFFKQPGSETDKLVANANDLANKAVRMAPADSFARSALAWAQYVGGEREEAIGVAKRAVDLDPENQLSRNFYGTMAAFHGRGKELITDARSVGLPPEEFFYPFTVARAYFQTGRYDDAIRIIVDMANETGRTSNLMTAILAASYQAIGENRLAEKYAKDLKRNAPDFDKTLRRMYTYKEDADEIIDRYQRAASGS